MEIKWEPIPRKGRLPFGYIVNPDNPQEYIPDQVICSLLTEAFEALNGGRSVREVVDWLNGKLPEGIRHLSHMGLRDIWMRSGHRTVAVKKPPKLKITNAQRKERRRNFKIGNEKRKIAAGIKRMEKLGIDIENIKAEAKAAEPLRGVVEVEFLPEEKEPENIIFKPNPGPQTDFLSATEQEVLYGGAAGGGKSYAMLADPIRYFSNPNFRGLLLRRTNDELKELKWKAQDLYNNPLIKGKFKSQESIWVFPSGAEFWLTYLERDEDVKRYQGQSFTWIGVDELTQYPTSFAWDYLRSRLRSVDLTVPLCMRATTNPGGVGHGWVKRMFIDPAPANTTFNATDIDTGEVLVHPMKYQHPHPKAGEANPKGGQPLFQRRFIPASLYDNPYLMQDDSYEASLLSLPEDTRRRLLGGDWNVAEGAAFSEFRESVHTCKPFEIPSGWRRFRSCDFGYSTFSAVHWYAIDPDNRLFVYRELYTSKKTGKDLAQMILNIEKNEKITYGVLDSSVWAMRGQAGPSIAEEMISAGCRWRPSDRSQGSRVAGKNRLHELLKVDDTGKPGIIFFNNCRQIISDLPVIPMDPNGGEDIDDKYASDHSYDSIRYGIMSRPRPSNIWEMGGAAPRSSVYLPNDPGFGY